MAILDVFRLGYDGYILLLGVPAIVALVVLYPRLFPGRLDSQEPPVIWPTIPVIGHLIGLIRLSHHYHRLNLYVSLGFGLTGSAI
jgi:hypothetical protein